MMRFTKMHGAGNDYVYINGFTERVEDPAALAVRMSEPHFGVGSDGLILVLPSTAADFRMRMFNRDGSEGVMCGNGARCVGRFVYDQGLTDRKTFTLETGGGVREINLRSGPNGIEAVCVDMGAPQEVASRDRYTYVSMGNPHAVFLVEEDPFTMADFVQRTEPICLSDDVNVEYVKIITPDRMLMRVYERGSAETFACGSGACASVVAMHAQGLCASSASVQMRGGEVEVCLRVSDGHVLLTGPAVTVFEGQWHGGR